jgi:glycosyltransferase involved in cell wall biosynthesis
MSAPSISPVLLERSVEPAPRRTEPERVGGSPAIFLVLGVAGVIVLSFAQLYYFTKLPLFSEGLHGLSFVLTVTFGTSFLFFCWLGAFRHTLMMTFAYLGWTQTVRPQAEPASWPRVSVLVPAFNESEQIVATLRSLLALDYPDLEVLVVDDGSRDDTFALACRLAGRHGNVVVRVLRKANGGKSSALNLGFRESSGDLILCVDADSRLEASAVRLLARTFENPTVGVAAGQVRVRNRRSLTAKLQALEYGLMNGMPRLAQSNFAYVLIAPGPVAMFRRTVLDEIWRRWGSHAESARAVEGYVKGPWENDTYAEDCDITLNALLLGKRSVFEPKALSFTTCPDWLFPLLNQRYRWIRGNIQALVARHLHRRVGGLAGGQHLRAADVRRVVAGGGHHRQRAPLVPAAARHRNDRRCVLPAGDGRELPAGATEPDLPQRLQHRARRQHVVLGRRRVAASAHDLDLTPRAGGGS